MSEKPQRHNLFADRFELTRRAGRGNQGTVHQARNLITHETVALKIFEGMPSPEEEAKLLSDAGAIARLDHPHFIAYRDHGVHEGSFFVAMEWIEECEKLGERLRRKPLTMAEAVDMGRRLAGALGKLHGAGVVHRNVKLDSVLLRGGEPSAAKLSDKWIEIVQLVRVAYRSELMGALAGFISPEHGRTGNGDARADVYSLGAVLFRCIAGCMPFAEDDNPSVRMPTLARRTAPRLSELRPDTPPDLCDLVARMLAHDEVDRPADGNEVSIALGQLGPLGRGAGDPPPRVAPRPIPDEPYEIAVRARPVQAEGVSADLARREAQEQRESAQRQQLEQAQRQRDHEPVRAAYAELFLKAESRLKRRSPSHLPTPAREVKLPRELGHRCDHDSSFNAERLDRTRDPDPREVDRVAELLAGTIETHVVVALRGSEEEEVGARRAASAYSGLSRLVSSFLARYQPSPGPGEHLAVAVAVMSEALQSGIRFFEKDDDGVYKDVTHWFNTFHSMVQD